MDDTRRLRLSVVHVELPDGVQFEQYVLRMPKASMTVIMDDARKNVLMIYRHRFIMDRWTWELPGGYVDADEDPALTAAREVEEETGWRPRSTGSSRASSRSPVRPTSRTCCSWPREPRPPGSNRTSTRPLGSSGFRWTACGTASPAERSSVLERSWV
ncbi:MAG: NUDIX hydrolase [Sciscionella sp.]